MQAEITWRGDASFEAKSGSGHSLILDGPPDHGGKNQGPRPMEMLRVGVGGCSTFDVVEQDRTWRIRGNGSSEVLLECIVCKF